MLGSDLEKNVFSTSVPDPDEDFQIADAEENDPVEDDPAITYRYDKVINRPGVAGAVLQSPPLLIN